MSERRDISEQGWSVKHQMAQLLRRWIGPRSVVLGLGLIVLLATVLRLWGLNFGLPNLTRPDENHLSKFVMEFILKSFFEGRPDLNPHFFHYPSLYIYLLTMIFSTYYLIGYWLGWFADGMAFWQMYHTDWSVFHLLQRLMSAGFGIATVPVTYLLSKTASKSRRIGLMSALILAVTYLHVRDSHFGVTDTTCTFFGIVSLWLSVLYYRNGSLKTLYWSAVFAGLAATTKYPLGLVMLSAYGAFWFRQKRAGYDLESLLSAPSQLRVLVTMTLIVFGVFFACSPYILLDPQGFYQDFVVEQFDAIMNTNYVNVDPGWWYHLRFSFWYGLGPLYEIWAFAGIAWCLWRRRSPVHWILLAFFISFYAVNAQTRYVFVRYIIPLIPLMALYAAWLIHDTAAWFTRYLPLNWIPAFAGMTEEKEGMTGRARVKNILTAALLLAMCWHSLDRSLGVNTLFAQKDTRTQAREWLMTHTKPGDAIGIGLVFSHIDLPGTYQRYFLSPKQGQFKPGQGTPTYLYSPKAEVSYNTTDRSESNITTYSDAETLRKLGIRYFTVSVAPLPFYRLPDQELIAVAKNPNFRQVANFRPFPQGTEPLSKETYDQIDGFFIPFSEFTGMTHPGPEIRIYEVLPKQAK